VFILSKTLHFQKSNAARKIKGFFLTLCLHKEKAGGLFPQHAALSFNFLEHQPAIATVGRNPLEKQESVPLFSCDF